jgi:hypothetical protein
LAYNSITVGILKVLLVDGHRDGYGTMISAQFYLWFYSLALRIFRGVVAFAISFKTAVDRKAGNVDDRTFTRLDAFIGGLAVTNIRCSRSVCAPSHPCWIMFTPFGYMTTSCLHGEFPYIAVVNGDVLPPTGTQFC